MLFTQYYSSFLICVDVYEMYRLWTSSAMTLSSGSQWFDKGSNAPLGVSLYSFLLVYLTSSRLLVAMQPLNRWTLFIAAVTEGIRLLLFSLFFSTNMAASQWNTVTLTFTLFNMILYGRLYYTTMCMLRKNAMEPKPEVGH